MAVVGTPAVRQEVLQCLLSAARHDFTDPVVLKNFMCVSSLNPPSSPSPFIWTLVSKTSVAHKEARPARCTSGFDCLL